MTKTLPRIGYSPIASDLAAPGDHRRFVAYARARGLHFELARADQDYDIVVLSEAADISVWPDYQRGKIVYDLIDSYLSVPRTDPKQLLRGPAWYVLGKHQKLRFDYLSSIRAMCRRADAVVCSTLEQRDAIGTFCSNVHLILDAHSTVVRNVKEVYAAGEPFRLVWEGLPNNLPQLAEVAPILRRLAEKRAFELHVVTDRYRSRLKGMLGRIETRDFLARHFSNAVFHEWHEQTCSEIVTSCDIALIPIDLRDPFVCGKPENKLLLLWRMAMPVVVAATPAYRRAMAAVGTPELACETESQWIAAIEQMCADQDGRRDAAARGRVYAERAHGSEVVFAAWDRLFQSLGYSFSPMEKVAG